MNRRRFIKNSAALSAAGLLFSPGVFAQPKLIEKIGIQFFSLPKLLEKDFAGALALLSKMGYKEVELYGPYPFSTEAAKNAGMALRLHSDLKAVDILAIARMK